MSNPKEEQNTEEKNTETSLNVSKAFGPDDNSMLAKIMPGEIKLERGDQQPKEQDIDFTSTIIKAGELLGVNVIDHIIVSSNGITSLRESNSYLWN